MSKKEYIEREVAIEKLNEHLHAMIDEAPISQGTKDIYEMAYRHVEDVLRKAIPAADVVEVWHGKWQKRLYYRPSTQSYDCEMYACSECGNELSYDAETGMRMCYWNYCPNCGAKMDGGVNDAAD